jgi:hypothetical protein
MASSASLKRLNLDTRMSEAKNRNDVIMHFGS